MTPKSKRELLWEKIAAVLTHNAGRIPERLENDLDRILSEVDQYVAALIKKERLEAAREAQAAKFADYLTSLDPTEAAQLLAVTLYMYIMEPTNADKVSYKIDGFSRNGKVLGDMKLTAALKAANPPIERKKV
jgi:hypothetical protein